MALRTRIAVTFLLLLAAVLAAALGAVLATNRDSAGREVQRQLDVGALVLYVPAAEHGRDFGIKLSVGGLGRGAAHACNKGGKCQ